MIHIGRTEDAPKPVFQILILSLWLNLSLDLLFVYHDYELEINEENAVIFIIVKATTYLNQNCSE